MTTAANQSANAEQVKLVSAFRTACDQWNGRDLELDHTHARTKLGEALYSTARALIQHLECEGNHRAPHCFDDCTSANHLLQRELAAKASNASLEGLRERLLKQPLPARDQWGHALHPSIPDTDEDVNMVMLLAAHGIAAALVAMESDAPAMAEAYFESGTADFSGWNPTPPEGEGWLLLGIYDTEEGPYALFGREDRSVAFPKRTAALAEKPEAADALDAQRYRHLRSRMVFTLDGKTREQTMTLASPLSAWRHHFGSDWKEPRFGASVDRTVDDSITAATALAEAEGGEA